MQVHRATASDAAEVCCLCPGSGLPRSAAGQEELLQKYAVLPLDHAEDLNLYPILKANLCQDFIDSCFLIIKYPSQPCLPQKYSKITLDFVLSLSFFDLV